MMYDLGRSMYLLLPFVALAAEVTMIKVPPLLQVRCCTCTMIHLDLCLSSVLFELLMCHGRTLMYKVWQTHTCVDTLHSL